MLFILLVLQFGLGLAACLEEDLVRMLVLQVVLGLTECLEDLDRILVLQM